MLTELEEPRSVNQFGFTSLMASEKYIILKEVAKIFDNAEVSITEQLHRRKALSKPS